MDDRYHVAHAPSKQKGKIVTLSFDPLGLLLVYIKKDSFGLNVAKSWIINQLSQNEVSCCGLVTEITQKKPCNLSV